MVSNSLNTQYDYSFFSRDGLDHRLIALYCARRIIKGFSKASYIQTKGWEEELQAFIAGVIYRSHMAFGVAVAALILARRYQRVSLAKEDTYAPSLNDARRVFLISYMTAAKVAFDTQFTLRWWKRVVERDYDCADLAKLELMFYETVIWNVQIDRNEFYQCLQQTFGWYQKFVDEYSLPASPLPTYQPFRERTVTLPKYLHGLEVVPLVDREDETRMSRAMELPLPCTLPNTQGNPRRFSRMFSGLRRHVLS